MAKPQKAEERKAVVCRGGVAIPCLEYTRHESRLCRRHRRGAAFRATELREQRTRVR